MDSSRRTPAASTEHGQAARPPAGGSRSGAASAGQRPAGRKAGAIIGVLALAVFMSSLDLFIVNLAFPYIGRQYAGTTLSSLSWVLNGYTIVFASVLVPAGRWADRIGRRRVFVAGLAAFSLGSLLCGLAPGVPALIGARVIQAAGAGLMVPASLSLLLAAVPAARRAAAIGTWAAFGAMGAALGPVIGGGLVQLSWRWVFWINIPIGLAAIVMAVRVVPESRDDGLRKKAGPRGRGAAGRVRRPDRAGAGQGSGLGLELGNLSRHDGRGARQRHGHGLPLARTSLPRDRARAAEITNVQRRVRSVDPLLRGLRRLRTELRRVPHRRLALLRGTGRPGYRAWPADGAALRQARRAAGRPHRRPGPGGRDRLPRQRSRAAALVHQDPGDPRPT